MKTIGIAFWLAVAWLFLAGMLVLQFWPHVPESKMGWVLLVGFGPPLYVLAEGASEHFWRSRTGDALSRPSRNMQRIFIGLSIVVGGTFAYFLWWLAEH